LGNGMWKSLSDRSHLKLIGLGIVLGSVLSIAAFQQFSRPEPVAKASPPQVAERTVFGERQTPAKEVASQPPAPVVESSESPAKSAEPPVKKSELPAPAHTVQLQGGIRDAAGLPGELRTFLDRWRNTMVAGDAAGQADLYANLVDRFYTRSNVSRAEVRREKEQLLAKYPQFHRFKISDVRLETLESDRAVVTLHKEWDARGRGRFAGAERQRLTLSKESGSWRIVGEEETRVYWMRRT
jgi:hypothetical protein